MIQNQKRAFKPVAKPRISERRNPVFKGLALLVENELEKAEIVLNAKSITDKLQSMAENLAKVEADDLMPMLDAMRETFGAQHADSFNNAVTEKVRELMNAVKGAKDAIGNEIMRLEGEVTGEPMGDMASDADTMGGDMGDDMGDNAAPMGGAPAGPPAPEDDEEAEPMGDDEEEDGEDPFADILKGGDADGAAGRARKESFARRASPLAGKRNPDRVVFEGFRKRLGEGKSPRVAMISTARFFGIDAEDVLRIVKEARGGSEPRRPFRESMISDARKAELKKMGYAVNMDGRGARWVKPKQGTNTNSEEMRAPARDESMAWTDLDKHVRQTTAKSGNSGAMSEDASSQRRGFQAENGNTYIAYTHGPGDFRVYRKTEKGGVYPYADGFKTFGEAVKRADRAARMNEAAPSKKPDADKDGLPDWADKHPKKKAPAFIDRKKAVEEAKKKAAKKDDPCWKDYEMVGMKKKGGREVPNCVPKNESRQPTFDGRAKHVKDMALDAGIKVSHAGNDIFVASEDDARKLRAVIARNPFLADFRGIHVSQSR